MKHIKLKLPKINKIIFLVFLIILGSYLIIMILKNKENFRRRRLPPNSYKCAKEGSNCNCDGEVFFGRGRKWSKPKKVPPSGKIKCKNSIFGDPFPGKKKVCRCVPAKQDAELKVGDSVKCTDGLPSGAPAGTQHKSTRVYRYMGEKELASYPSSAIASSWNPNWNLDIKNIKCKDYKWAKPMKLKINPGCNLQVSDKDIQCYLDKYPDLRGAFGNDLNAARCHYVKHGKAQGRLHTCQQQSVNQYGWKQMDGFGHNKTNKTCINEYTPHGIPTLNFRSALKFDNTVLTKDQKKQGIQFCKDICRKDCDCKAVNIHTTNGSCRFIKSQYNERKDITKCMEQNCYPKPNKDIEDTFGRGPSSYRELQGFAAIHARNFRPNGAGHDLDSRFNDFVKKKRMTAQKLVVLQPEDLKEYTEDEVEFIMYIIQKIKDMEVSLQERCAPGVTSNWTDARYKIGTGRSSMLMDPMKDWKAFIKPIDKYCLPNESWNDLNIYFDHIAYADLNPDIKKEYGYDKEKLYNHYIKKEKEGIYSIAKDKSGKDALCDQSASGNSARISPVSHREYVSDINVAKQRCTALPFCTNFNARKDANNKLEIVYGAGFYSIEDARSERGADVRAELFGKRDGKSKCASNDAKYELVKQVDFATDGACGPIEKDVISKGIVSDINVAKKKCTENPDCTGFTASPETSNKLNIIYKKGLIKEENMSRVDMGKSKCYRHIIRDQNEKNKSTNYSHTLHATNSRCEKGGGGKHHFPKDYARHATLAPGRTNKIGSWWIPSRTKTKPPPSHILDKVKQNCTEMQNCTGFSTWTNVDSKAGGPGGTEGDLINVVTSIFGDFGVKGPPANWSQTLNASYFKKHRGKGVKTGGNRELAGAGKCFAKLNPEVEAEAKIWDSAWKKL